MYDFTILVFEGAFPSGVAATGDILATAERLAARGNDHSPRWRFCSMAGGLVPLQGGIAIATEKLPLDQEDDHSTWVIPGMAMNTPVAIDERLRAADIALAIPRLQHHARSGGNIAASCSAVFLLHAAGLLEGRRVTTTWWLAPYLQTLAPNCQADVERMVCSDGNLTTAGTAFAQIDLMVHLLKERCGHPLADLTTRMLLVEGRQAQTGFIVPEMLAGGDELMANLTRRIESALPNLPKINVLAQELGMSERTLARRIQRATGRSPLALIQSIKLRRAKALLENSRLGLEQIATAVGYSDASALRRLMKKKMGANPRHFR